METADWTPKKREVPTILLMRLAFGRGLCRYGMFRARKAAAPVSGVPV